MAEKKTAKKGVLSEPVRDATTAAPNGVLMALKGGTMTGRTSAVRMADEMV